MIYMNLNWPEDYQQRIEVIIGAKFNGTHVDFLGFDTFKTIVEAKRALDHIRIMQKQLHQLKIKVIRSHRMPIMKHSAGILRLSSTISNVTSNRSIRQYQNVAFTIDRLLDKCGYQKNNVDIWMKGQIQKSLENSNQRQAIPDEVQMFVWNRDGGKCVKCGSQEYLEYDHIIPLSMGGSNTARNIQLLCEPCNRKKSNSIGG
jgi:5-methylcytosine-specific restriction endonuclease McrA